MLDPFFHAHCEIFEKPTILFISRQWTVNSKFRNHHFDQCIWVLRREVTLTLKMKEGHQREKNPKAKNKLYVQSFHPVYLRFSSLFSSFIYIFSFLMLTDTCSPQSLVILCYQRKHKTKVQNTHNPLTLWWTLS